MGRLPERDRRLSRTAQNWQTARETMEQLGSRPLHEGCAASRAGISRAALACWRALTPIIPDPGRRREAYPCIGNTKPPRAREKCRKEQLRRAASGSAAVANCWIGLMPPMPSQQMPTLPARRAPSMSAAAGASVVCSRPAPAAADPRVTRHG